jgi:hypothetical protein
VSSDNKLYLWDIRITEKGDIRNFHKKEVDEEFIEEHPWIPRINYDRNSVAGWDSNYMNPEYCAQFYCKGTDLETVLFTAGRMWRDALRYSMEEEAMRLYLEEMETNPNATRFLRTQALLRWEWLSHKDYLREDLRDWKERVEESRKKHGYKVT